MRAWTHSARGSPSTVLCLDLSSRPEFVPSCHFNEIPLAALTPMSRMLTKLIPNPFDGPRSHEMEFVGTTTMVGDGVRSELRQQGTQVFGVVHLESNLKRLWHQWRQGSLAEYVVAH